MSEKIRVQIVQPRADVEVHLPHGIVLSGPRGAQVGEFLKAVEFSRTGGGGDCQR